MTGDTIKEIRQCLECRHPRCINCLEGQKGHKTGRPGKALIGRKKGEIVHFPSLAAAAAALKVSNTALCHAIKRGQCCAGYYWKYEGVR